MMNKVFRRKSLLLSVVAIILALALVPMSVLGWFAISERNRADNVNIAVTGGSARGTLDIVLSGGQPSGTIPLDTILPGNYLYGNIMLNNTTSSEKSYKIYIDRVAVKYPNSMSGFVYDDSYIFCEDYYHNDTLIDPYAFMNQQNFKKFVAPVTNALQYDMYYSSGIGFATGYIPQYITSIGNATSADLESENYIEYSPQADFIALSKERGKEGELALEDGSILIEEGVMYKDGAIILDGGKIFTLYLVLYFSPYAYTNANVEYMEQIINVSLKNSNPYVMQNFAITLSIEND